MRRQRTYTGPHVTVPTQLLGGSGRNTAWSMPLSPSWMTAHISEGGVALQTISRHVTCAPPTRTSPTRTAHAPTRT